MHKEARNHARRFVRMQDAALHRNLEHLRKTNPHRLFQHLSRLTASDPLSFACTSSLKPNEDGHPVAHERFFAYYRQLFSSTIAAPPAATPEGASWLQYVASAAPGDLWSCPISLSEIYLIVFPSHKDILPPDTCPGVGASCKACDKYKANHSRWVRAGAKYDGIDDLVPHFVPHLHTSTAGGPDNVLPEYISWARPECTSDIHPYRLIVSNAIAQWCNLTRSEGRIPDDIAVCRTVPIAKNAKPGTTTNDADPADNRPITMGSCLGKILGLVIMKRLMHWAVANKLISAEQVGFMEGKGCEDHIFTLLETIRARRRQKKATYALFVDLAKAYDSVHPQALWRCLLHMGVPPDLVALLQDWSAKRRTVVRVNGLDSEPIEMKLGLGQGDVLSPLLFNLFTDSLTRFVKQRCPDGGVDVLGVRITVLMYADDSVFFAESPAQLQLMLGAFHDWCKAWGLTVNTGAGKTEAMAFLPVPTPGQAPPPPLEPLYLVDPSRAINWTPSYRYLGLLLNSELDMSPACDAIIDRMRKMWFSKFVYSRATTHGSPAMSLQLFRTVVLCCCNYIIGIIDPPASFTAKLDRFINTAARMIMRLPWSTPAATVAAESRLPCAEALVLRDSLRFRLKLVHSDFPGDLAPRLYTALATAGRPAMSHRRFSIRSWVLCHDRRLERLEKEYIRRDRPNLSRLQITGMLQQSDSYLRQVIRETRPSSGSISPAEAAGRACRELARLRWTNALALKLRKRGTTIVQTAQADAALGRPGFASDTAFSAFVEGYCMSVRDPATGAWPIHPKIATPISLRGPLCNGGILSLVTRWPARLQWLSLMSMRRGRRGLLFNPVQHVRDRDLTECRLCHDRLSREDVFHVLCECQGGDLPNVRILAAAAAVKIIQLIVQESGPSSPLSDSLLHSLQETPCVWETPPGCIILFRLLSVLPWTSIFSQRLYYDAPLAVLPRAAINGPGVPTEWALFYSLALCFDAIHRKNHLLRRLGDAWCTAAIPWPSLFITSWVDAVAANSPEELLYRAARPGRRRTRAQAGGSTTRDATPRRPQEESWDDTQDTPESSYWSTSTQSTPASHPTVRPRRLSSGSNSSTVDSAV
jgi:hypothetical protein